MKILEFGHWFWILVGHFRVVDVAGCAGHSEELGLMKIRRHLGS